MLRNGRDPKPRPKTDATERTSQLEGHGPSWPQAMEGHALS